MPTDEVEVVYKLDLGEPSPQQLQWAKENIREDPDTKCQKLSEFRDMIYSRGECSPHRTDDAFLLRFLRSRRFHLEAAYKLFVNYYDFKEENPIFFEDIGFKCLEKAGKCDVIGVPPYRDQNGRRILLYKVGNWDPEFFTTDDFFRASFLILELAMLEPRGQISGGICIVDCGNVSMQHIIRMTPTLAFKIVQMAVTSHPMRLEALHVVNQSWGIDVIFNVFKQFLNGKMLERLYFHGNDMESLHQHIDPKCLPEIYGGLQPNHSYEQWIDWFRNTETITRELRSSGYNV